MPTRKRAGHTRDAWDEAKRSYLGEFSRRTGLDTRLEGRRSSRWARTDRGFIAITASRELRGGTWWFGLDDRELKAREVLGVVLLAESAGAILDFCLPAALLAEVTSRLSRDSRGEMKFVIRRQRDRYLLQVPGDADRDVTETLGNSDWARTLPESTTPTATPGAEPQETVFFARINGRVLEPLDRVDLPDGAVVLVRATRAVNAPMSLAFRRILAVGGAPSLPPDFAERHDDYAHGAART